MNRPGPVGLVMVLAFAVPVVIEFRTVLSAFGIDVATGFYYPVAVAVVASIVLGLLLLPEDEPGNPSEGAADSPR